jgi:hypothetical protein
MGAFIASELFVQTGSTKLGGTTLLFYSQSYLALFWEGVKSAKGPASFFFTVCPSKIHLFLFLEKDGLLPHAHFGPIVNISGVHKMIYNRTQSVSGQLQKCVWSSSDTHLGWANGQ